MTAAVRPAPEPRAVAELVLVVRIAQPTALPLLGKRQRGDGIGARDHHDDLVAAVLRTLARISLIFPAVLQICNAAGTVSRCSCRG
jgi:hypothetical protein